MDESGNQGYTPQIGSGQPDDSGNELKGPPLPKKHLVVTVVIAVLLLVDIILGGVIVFNITQITPPPEEENITSITPTIVPTRKPSPTINPTLIPSVSKKSNPTATAAPKATNTPAPTSAPTATPTPSDTTPPELIDFVGVTEGGAIVSAPGQTGCYPIRIRDNVTAFENLESRMRTDEHDWSNWDHEHEKCYSFSEGQHTIYTEIRDEAGNVGSYSRIFFIEYP